MSSRLLYSTIRAESYLMFIETAFIETRRYSTILRKGLRGVIEYRGFNIIEFYWTHLNPKSAVIVYHIVLLWRLVKFLKVEDQKLLGK